MREMKDSGTLWIGEIPKNKKVLRNKYMFSYEKGKLPSSTNLDKKGFAYIGATDLDSRKNEYSNYTEDETLPNAEYNDLLVLWDGARAGLCGTHKIGKISSTIVRIKGDESVYQPFLYWYYKGFENFMYQSVNGTTIPHMNRKYIENIGFIDWTIEEQQKISSYLDTKCAKIDSIIERQEKVIEKLKAYKLSVITEAVTKGLNPNVKMKDSGVEWIGEIPEHWEIGKIKHTISFIESGVSVNAGQNEATTNELGVLKTSSVSKFVFDVHENKSVNRDEECRVSCPVRSNTLIVSRMNTPELVGACGYVEQDYDNIFLPDRLWQVHFVPNLNVKFIWYYLRSKCVRYYISSLSTGTSSSMQNISQGQFGNIMLVLPPAVNQKDIVYYLDQKCSAIDKSIEQKQAIIEKLKEYKKSLIYEVVTGKKEV